jgi:sugar phosphate isomerase/epimerase
MNGETTPAKIGIFAGFSFHVPFRERMPLIRDAGFSATALWWEERHPEGRRLRHLAPAIVRDAGLDIDHIHVPYHNCADLWSDVEADRHAAITQHIEWLADCARHEIPRLVMHVAAGAGTPPPNANGLDSFRRMLDAAEEHAVTVAIENTRRPEHVHFLLEALDSSALGLCYDTSHDRLYADTPLDLLEAHAERLVTTHVSDTDGRRDLHLVPGDGVCDYAPLARALDRAPADLVLEIRQRDQEESPADYLARAYRAAKAILESANEPSARA